MHHTHVGMQTERLPLEDTTPISLLYSRKEKLQFIHRILHAAQLSLERSEQLSIVKPAGAICSGHPTQITHIVSGQLRFVRSLPWQVLDVYRPVSCTRIGNFDSRFRLTGEPCMLQGRISSAFTPRCWYRV